MSEELPNWSEVSDDEGNRNRPDPASRVNAPAKALIAIGCLAFVANFVLIVVLTLFQQGRGPVERPAGMNDEAFRAFNRRRQAAPFMDCCLISTSTLAVYPLVVVGGFSMKQMRTRWLAILGAILAMVPCSPVMLLGLPVGVWSLVVLTDPAVRTAFAGHRQRR